MLKELMKIANNLDSLGEFLDADDIDNKIKQIIAKNSNSVFIKSACVVASDVVGGDRILFKNRDRNYTPELQVYHEIRNGIEILFIEDELTGWLEGINEFGIGMVNAALMVGRDEAEKKMVKTIGRKSQDGKKILSALEQKDLESAIKAAVTNGGGVKGHTLISDPNYSYAIEATSKHNAVIKRIDDKLCVRTNHGIEYPDAGYTEGADYVSSVARKEKAIETLSPVDNVYNIAPSIYGERLDDRSSPNNMVRNTENMSSTSQVVFNLTQRKVLLYLIPGKVKYLGVKSELPDGYTPKISIEVFKYTDLDSDNEFDVIKKSPKKEVVSVKA